MRGGVGVGDVPGKGWAKVVVYVGVGCLLWREAEAGHGVVAVGIAPGLHVDHMLKQTHRLTLLLLLLLCCHCMMICPAAVCAPNPWSA
jgi:hypothetical protein